MKLVLKDIFSSDCNVETFVPKDPECFCVFVQVTIGTAEKPGGDTFQFGICSPGYIRREIAASGGMWGHEFLIMRQFDISQVKAAVNKLIQTTDSEKWEDAANSLSRYMQWEFADYKTYDQWSKTTVTDVDRPPEKSS